MKATKKRKLRIVNFGKPNFAEIPKPEADAFCKSLLEIILDLHKNNEETKKET